MCGAGSIRAALGDASMSSKFASPAAVPVLSSRLVPLLALALGVLGCMSAAPSGGSARRDGATATGTDGGGRQSPAAGAGAGTARYRGVGACMRAYTGLSDGPMGGKACVAWQLCIAAHPNNAATFCPRAPEASLMAGPCKPAYLM